MLTRPVFANIDLRYFYDSITTIGFSSITRSGDLATCNTNANHNYRQGDVISVINSTYPFTVLYVLIFDTPTLSSFRYVVSAAGGTYTNTGTVQKYENPFITWSYYRFSQYISSLETATKRLVPRNPAAYRLLTSPVNYTAELIFSVSKYQHSGHSMSGWYLIKYHNEDDAIAVLADQAKNDVAMQMFDGTFSYSDRQDKFLFDVDDHRSYKLWHGGFAYLKNNGTSDSNEFAFYKLNSKNDRVVSDLFENYSSCEIENRPAELTNTTQAMPARLSLSGYTIYFDNDNQRLIIQKKDGSRKAIVKYGAIGIGGLNGFVVSTGSGAYSISYGWYLITNNLDTIIIGNRSLAISSYRLIFNFNLNTVTVTGVSRLTDTNLSTEENCFGDQIDTYFNLRTNAVEAVRYYSGSTPTLTLRLYGSPLTDININTNDLTMTVPGSISQPGIGPVSIILSDGSVYWIDWGHDDRGMYRLTGNDDGLGIVKMVNMSVHPRLLSII